VKNPAVIFAGTPEFALVSLVALVDSGVVPVAVLTQPDRPAGRGKRMTSSPVKDFATQQGIAVLQPKTLRDETVVAELAALRPDIIVVAAYGLILPQDVLDLPPHGCLNVHASLLPRWRGAAPIQAAILSGDARTGISLMAMTAGLDSGPVYCTAPVTIEKNETAGELHDRLAALGGRLLVENLDALTEERMTASVQDEKQATYAGKINKQDAKLDWTLGADELQRRVRAYNPEPGAFFFLNGGPAGDSRDHDGVRVKCWAAHAVAEVNALPGTVVEGSSDALVIACGNGGLRLDSVQMPGKRRISAQELVAQIDLRGTRLPA
jgi:methionyl-tRNA formyltransferase